jgi:hypothetical protein
MIKFFRKIRQNLISENKTSKYFKYAIGEIILVVIGILIALQLNNWNENYKNEKEARFQLSKLKDNLKADKSQLKHAIAVDSSMIENLIICVKVLSNDLEASKEEFTNRFQYIFNTNDFNPTRGTFEGLISSGKIELITNQELLDALFSYYNNNSYTAWDSSIIDYSRNIFAPYLLNFDHVPNITDKNEGTDFTYFDVSKFSIPSKSIDAYKNDQFIINALRIKIQLFEGQKLAYLDLSKDIDELISRIENELK